MADKLQSFVRAIEVWRPDGDLLQRDSGAYGQLAAFEEASVLLVLKKGQGLPGAAWDTMRPEVWHELGSGFLRRAPARVGGIGAAVAIPFFHGSELVAVVAFYCGSRDTSEGCIEVWESNGKGELEHADGYYGKLSAFEKVSQECKFSRGQGLPGLVFQHGTPQIIDDLKKSNSFLRAAAARESGVASGLGFPIYRGDVIMQVVLLLSAEATPLARAFEIWLPDEDGRMHRRQAFYSTELDDFAEARRESSFGPGDDLVGRVLETQLPIAVGTQTRAYANFELARAAGIDMALAFPIDDGRSMRAVVVMFS
ncbi:MAG: hypothetical protein JWN04_1044 [Myxococcaceae bacterium]|nr:hypothetical protein [Myxococcaceae bacterium]